MAFPRSLTWLALLLASTLSWADDLQIKPDHPDTYVVVKGDTLWGISAKFLQNPWQWPLLWHDNPQIENPHLIYPGDVLQFEYVNGKPTLTLAEKEAWINGGVGDDNGLTVHPESGEFNIAPHIRKSEIEEAIALIPSKAIMPFLSSPEVVNPEQVKTMPYVLEIAGEHLVGAGGDRIFVRSITQAPTLSYTVYRPGKPYINPETGKILGYESLHIADATLEAEGDPAVLFVDRFKSEILKGDKVIPHPQHTRALNYFPAPPKATIVGSIISVLDGVSQVGLYSIVVIDKGKVDGLEPGHVFHVYQKGQTVIDPFHSQRERVKLPDIQAGSIMVFRPFDTVSYAIVLEAHDALHVLDRIATP